MSDVFALYKIQELELAIIGHTKRIKVINAEIENDAELHAAGALHSEAQAAFEESAKSAKDMELEIASVMDKRQAAEARLYSGEVTNPKELQDMQMETESLARRTTALETELSKIEAERDARKQTLDECEAALVAATERHQQDTQELVTEKTSLTESVNQLLSTRRSAVSDVPDALFKTYNDMRKAKANRPLSVLNEEACTVCGIEQNHIVIIAINRNEGPVNCQNCGRILIKL